MPEVEGFGADELAKITLARKQLAELEEKRLELLNGNTSDDAHSNGASPTEKWGKTSSSASH